MNRFSYKIHEDIAFFSENLHFPKILNEKSYEKCRPQYFVFWNLGKSIIILILKFAIFNLIMSYLGVNYVLISYN